MLSELTVEDLVDALFATSLYEAEASLRELLIECAVRCGDSLEKLCTWQGDPRYYTASPVSDMFRAWGGLLEEFIEELPAEGREEIATELSAHYGQAYRAPYIWGSCAGYAETPGVDQLVVIGSSWANWYSQLIPRECVLYASFVSYIVAGLGGAFEFDDTTSECTECYRAGTKFATREDSRICVTCLENMSQSEAWLFLDPPSSEMRAVDAVMGPAFKFGLIRVETPPLYVGLRDRSTENLSDVLEYLNTFYDDCEFYAIRVGGDVFGSDLAVCVWPFSCSLTDVMESGGFEDYMEDYGHFELAPTIAARKKEMLYAGKALTFVESCSWRDMIPTRTSVDIPLDGKFDSLQNVVIDLAYGVVEDGVYPIHNAFGRSVVPEDGLQEVVDHRATVHDDVVTCVYVALDGSTTVSGQLPPGFDPNMG